MSEYGDALRGIAQTNNNNALGADLTHGVGSDYAYNERMTAAHYEGMARHADIMAAHAKNGIFLEGGGGQTDPAPSPVSGALFVLGVLFLLCFLVYGIFQVGKNFANLPAHEALYKLKPSWGRDYYNAFVPKPWANWKLSNNPTYDRDATAARQFRAKHTPDYAKASLKYYKVFSPPMTSADVADIKAYKKRRDQFDKQADFYTGALALDCFRKAYDECLPISDFPTTNAVSDAADYLKQLAEKGDVQAAFDMGILYLQPAERGRAFDPEAAIKIYRWAAANFRVNSPEFSRLANVVQSHAGFMLKSSQ